MEDEGLESASFALPKRLSLESLAVSSSSWSGALSSSSVGNMFLLPLGIPARLRLPAEVELLSPVLPEFVAGGEGSCE